jgi:hypothetical protein
MIVGVCSMETKAFENVKNQIGCCGIWCGSCVVGNGTLKALAKRCEHVIGGYGVDEWAAKDFDGKEFMKGLAAIQTVPVCRGCLKGGGNEVCKIRPCVSNKKLHDCMECKDMKTCENTEALQKVRTGALRVGMLARTENDKTDRQELIKKWTAEIKSKCPHCGA